MKGDLLCLLPINFPVNTSLSPVFCSRLFSEHLSLIHISLPACQLSLDTALTEGVSKVDVTYAGKTVEIGIEVEADTPVEPETPTVDKVEIKANPAKTCLLYTSRCV